MADQSIEKESIVRSLLTSNTFGNLSSKLSPATSGANSIGKMQPSYLQFSYQTNRNSYMTPIEREQENVSMDHSYARSFNGTQETLFSQLTKVLFMPPPTKRKRSCNPLAPVQDCDEIIDIETVSRDSDELYDISKAKYMMGECDSLAAFTTTEEGSDDWEDSVLRINWTHFQHTLFDGIIKILNTLHLARLAYVDTRHEPVSRRIAIDRAVKRLRRLFASISWDSKTLQWLHQLLIDNLNVSYMSLYFDILQTLKVKLPNLVDKIMFAPNAHNRVGVLSNESLMHLFKKPWDPYATYLTQNKPRKLPGNPVLLLIPSTPNSANANYFKRQHKWSALMSNFATTVTVHTNIGASNRTNLTSCADQMLVSARSKLQDVKSEFPGRPVVLIGLNAGSSIALQLAQTEAVMCVVCLGFSVLTAEGKRSDPDDNLLELQRPVLFVVGQCSTRSLPEDVENLREQLRCESSLLIVGAADDYLRVKKRTKYEEGLTQSVIDRIIADNVAEFIGSVLMSPYQSQSRNSPAHLLRDIHPKRIKTSRNRQYSNGSSLDSEPPSPTLKVTRPVGRPPGSKSKSKLEAKWAAQIAQGTSSPSHSPPRSHSHKSDTSSHEISNSKNLHTTNSSKKTVDQQQMRSEESNSTGNNTIPHLVQGACRPGNVPSRSGIKVLENVQINPGVTKHGSPIMNRTVDLSKITVLNSLNAQKPGMMMLDNKFKTGTTIRGFGNTPFVLPISNKNKLAGMSGPSTPTGQPRKLSKNVSIRLRNKNFPGFTKYVTGKKQLVGRKIPIPPAQKTSFTTFTSSTLTPPTNLTSQDIMDLPIIFADDNQILTSDGDTKLQQTPEVITIAPPEISQPPKPSNPVGKFVFINKQIPYQNAKVPSTITNAAIKRPAVAFPVQTNANTKDVRYTRIIISQPSNDSVVQSTATSSISKIETIETKPKLSEITLVPAPTDIDIENTLSASKIVKPGFVKFNKDETDDLPSITNSKNVANDDVEFSEDE